MTKVKVAKDFTSPPSDWYEKYKRNKERREKFDKEYEAWSKKYGKQERTFGTCKLCNSRVKADRYWQQDGPVIIGGRSNGRTVTRGYYCTNEDCGIMYKTCPKPIIEVPYEVPPPVYEGDE